MFSAVLLYVPKHLRVEDQESASEGSRLHTHTQKKIIIHHKKTNVTIQMPPPPPPPPHTTHRPTHQHLGQNFSLLHTFSSRSRSDQSLLAIHGAFPDRRLCVLGLIDAGLGYKELAYRKADAQWN